MQLLAVFLLLVSAAAVHCTRSPIINADGLIKSNAAVHSSLDEVLSQSDLVSAFSCVGVGEGSEVFRALADDDINLNEEGVSLHSCEDFLSVLCQSDQWSSTRFCGAKGVAFCTLLPFPVVLSMKDIDFNSMLISYELVVRKLVMSIKEEEDRMRKEGQTDAAVKGKSVQVVVIVSGGSGIDDEDAVRSKVLQLFKQVQEDLAIDVSSSLRLDVVQLPTSPSPDDLMTLRLRVLDLVGDGQPVLDKEGFLKALTDAWAKIPKKVESILSKSEKQALYEVEAAYAHCLQQAELSLHLMHRRLDSGKCIPSFAPRVQTLINDVCNEYVRRTQGNEMVQEKIERLGMLRQYIYSHVERMFQEQVGIKENEVVRALKKELLRVYSKHSGDGVKEELQKVMRKSLLDFTTYTNSIELAGGEVGGADGDASGKGIHVSDSVMEAFSERLKTLVDDFPETPEAKLADIHKVEQEVRRGSAGWFGKGKGKGRGKAGGKKRAFAWSLNLVGLLRPPGMGNLQGYANYATRVWGIPVECLLAFQNDGESVEVMGEDREHPLLRLQPKFNFEIDL
eukprot:gene28615-34543_t